MQCLEKKRADRPASGARDRRAAPGACDRALVAEAAAEWWEDEGREIIMGRDGDLEVGSLATIQAEPGVQGNMTARRDRTEPNRSRRRHGGRRFGSAAQRVLRPVCEHRPRPADEDARLSRRGRGDLAGGFRRALASRAPVRQLARRVWSHGSSRSREAARSMRCGRGRAATGTVNAVLQRETRPQDRRGTAGRARLFHALASGAATGVQALERRAARGARALVLSRDVSRPDRRDAPSSGWDREIANPRGHGRLRTMLPIIHGAWSHE